jgi:hypothetical protein
MTFKKGDVGNPRGTPRNLRAFPKGVSGNPAGSSAKMRAEAGPPKVKSGRPPGRPPGSIIQRRRPASERPSVVLWDLQQAAKDKSKRGLEILQECMEDTTCEWPVRLKAIEMLWERGYGRPQVSVAMNMNHNFAVVPEVMGQAEWLERKGQPVGHAAPGKTHQRRPPAHRRGIQRGTDNRPQGGGRAAAGRGPHRTGAAREQAQLTRRGRPVLHNTRLAEVLEFAMAPGRQVCRA